jgi:hypothetical protein
MSMFIGMSDAFRNRAHALWRELLQVEPISAEDESQHAGFLRWFESGVIDSERPYTNDRLIDITNYLEERAFTISRMDAAARLAVANYRRLRAERLARDSWQNATPRTATKAEHDALMADAGASPTRTMSKEDYDRAIREAQE